MDESAAYYNQTSMAGVPSGSTYNFTWIIAERSGPGPNDGNATLWGYHSHLQDPGDIYSGLVGGFVIYNKGVLDPVTHFPTDVDEEFLLNFMVYNENLSPYLYASIKKFAPELSDRLLSNPKTPFTIPGVTWTESNKMHSVNGRMFGNLDGLDVGVGKRVRWHIMVKWRRGDGEREELEVSHLIPQVMID